MKTRRGQNIHSSERERERVEIWRDVPQGALALVCIIHYQEERKSAARNDPIDADLGAKSSSSSNLGCASCSNQIAGSLDGK